MGSIQRAVLRTRPILSVFDKVYRFVDVLPAHKVVNVPQTVLFELLTSTMAAP